MERKYTPVELEPRWQRRWEEERLFSTGDGRSGRKFYVLEMFPYPSGKIHMGHVRNYTIGDVVARTKRMEGFDILHPMGWDAFGMPAENAAIAKGVHPAVWTYENIDHMRTQLKRLGFSYDWSRELATCDPEYYRWEQKIFIEMYRKGLAYKKKSTVNWCPACTTVLANEQVEGGGCWRCGSVVETRELDQWFLKITAYADELYEGCDTLAGWPEKVVAMQKNWIGKSRGCELEFPLADGSGSITVFTTRQDTVFGATFMSIAPEHPRALQLARGTAQQADVTAYIEKAANLTKIQRMQAEYEKEGVFTGGYCLNPFTGEKIPVFIANFVLMDYGTGAVMAVPAHDERDFQFARKYKLPVRVVIQPDGPPLDPGAMDCAWTGEGRLVNSGAFNGVPNEDAKAMIAEAAEREGKGRRTTNYRLRDWGISRQRYWGAPIPMLYCERCGVVPVPEDQLPVVLPRDVAITGTGASPLASLDSFVHAACPQCGGAARRETDTMDTFMESSWYFIRYCSPRCDSAIFDRGAVDYWMPVEQYIGGVEHAILHLLYARFYTKVLRDLGYLAFDEPFTNLLTQGMVCMESYKCPEHGHLFPEEAVEKDGGRVCSQCAAPVTVGRVEKMSKSKKNLVDPDRLVNEYGADTARLFCLFAAPPEKDLDWSERGVEGCFRFLQRVWRLVDAWLPVVTDWQEMAQSAAGTAQSRDILRVVHKTIAKVTEETLRRYHFNTAVAAIMEMVNALNPVPVTAENAPAMRFALQRLVIMLSPFTPFVCDELWERMGFTDSVALQAWPQHDPAMLAEDMVTIVAQVNGKVRGRFEFAAGTSQAAMETVILADEKIVQLTGGTVMKTIWVPGKLVNIIA